MSQIIDARGKPCPQPVLLAAEALKSAGDVTIIVDNAGSRQNVTKFATTQGCSVTAEEKADGIYVRLVRTSPAAVEKPTAPLCSPSAGGIVIFIGADIIGRGENLELGKLLIQSFLNTIRSLPNKPETVIFMNNGVKLVAEDSHVLGELKQLADEGIELLACGTCLSRLGLANKIAVGQVSNMFTIADTMLRAAKVISL